MTFQNLNKINSEPAFQESRLMQVKSILLLLTLAGVSILLLWQLFDLYFLNQSNRALFWLRLSTGAVFLGNYLIAFLRKTNPAFKQHLTAVFYSGTLFCMVFVLFTGADQSPYWFGLFFILISWFILVPFTYRELIVHSFLFFFLFLAGILSQSSFPAIDYDLIKIVLLYSGILFIGAYAAYTRNNVEAKNYLSNKALALKNKELSKFRLVLEQAPGSVIIMDKEMKFEYINPVFTQLSGYTKEDLLNKNIQDTIYRGETPESRIEVARFLQMGETWQGELLTYHKTGKSYWANTIAAPYKDESGNIEGYIVIQQDVSGQVELQEALQRSESRYKTLVENSQDGILIIRDDKVLFANNTIAKIMGYSIEEYYSLTSINMLHPDDWHKAAEIGKKRNQLDFSTIHLEFRMITKTGEIKECEATSSIIEFDGQMASFFTITDLTDRKQMMLKLRENEEKYRQLFQAESDAIFVVDADTGEILDANPAASANYGYSYEELLQMKNSDISAEPHKTTTATQNRISMVPLRLHRKKDGTVFPVELSAGFTVLQNRNIQIVTSRDITERIQNQEALSKSEQKYRELTEMLPQAIYELDAQGNPTYMNKAGLKIFGIENGTGDKKAFDFFIPEDMARMKQALKMEAAHLTSHNGELEPIPSDPMEFTAQRPDGTQFPVLIYGTSIVENGVITGSRGMIIDISERKAMENAIRESESKYKTLIENSQDGIFAIVGDKVQFVNNTLCKMLGYSADELYNMPAINMVIPEDRERGLEISQRRLQGDWSTVNGIFHFLAKDGTIRECDTYSSILELNGQIVSYITVHDLTEARRMQEKLQQSEEKYRTVIENATDGIVITQQGKLRFLNKSMCEMMQYTEDEIIEKPFLDYVIAEDQQLMIDFHRRRMAGEDFSSLYRSHLIRKDGKIITVELNARTSYYNGEPAAFIIIRDISDREKIENELQTAKQNLEKLNRELEQRIIESSESLTEARTQLINLQKENLQSQFDVLKQQVNPHFLFNSLNVLTSLIKLEPDLAEKFTEHLSKVYRYVLENKDNELVKLTTELDFLDAYIFLLNIRFMGKLIVNIRIPDEKRNCLVIPLAMQLLIENAIKHNAMSKKSPLVIDVFIDNNHFLNIINNLQEREAHMASTGVGLKNIQNRYLLLNNSAPEFEKTTTHFIARIPLICDQYS